MLSHCRGGEPKAWVLKGSIPYLENVLAPQSALALGDERTRVVAETTPIRERLAREREALEVVVNKEVERICLPTRAHISIYTCISQNQGGSPGSR